MTVPDISCIIWHRHFRNFHCHRPIVGNESTVELDGENERSMDSGVLVSRSKVLNQIPKEHEDCKCPNDTSSGYRLCGGATECG